MAQKLVHHASQKRCAACVTKPSHKRQALAAYLEQLARASLVFPDNAWSLSRLRRAPCRIPAATLSCHGALHFARLAIRARAETSDLAEGFSRWSQNNHKLILFYFILFFLFVH